MPIHYSRWTFHEHGIHACKWNIFMRMTTAKLISEQHFGKKNSIIPRIARISLIAAVPNMVKSTIVHYVFRTLTLWNSLFRYNCHEWLRPDLEIPFSNSSNKHGTGKADEIFTEVWRDTFYTIAMWKFSENSRDSRRRLTYLFNGELYYLSPMNEKR